MRVNAFRDKYCHTADEVLDVMNEYELANNDVYASDFDPPDGVEPFTMQIMRKHNGDLLCYIEAPTEAGIRVMLETLHIKEID